jgi:hypothetical protein
MIKIGNRTDKANSNNNYQAEPFKTSSVAAEFSRKKGVSTYRWLFISCSLLALGILIALIVVVSFNNVEVIPQWQNLTSPWLSIWRLFLFLALIGGWRYWSELYTQWASLNESQLSQMLSYRWRIALWLLIMEAIFSQHLLTELFVKWP